MGRLAKKLEGSLQPGQKAYKKGGAVEDKATAKKEIEVFKKAGRPDLVKHEKKEAGLKKGGCC